MPRGRPPAKKQEPADIVDKTVQDVAASHRPKGRKRAADSHGSEEAESSNVNVMDDSANEDDASSVQSPIQSPKRTRRQSANTEQMPSDAIEESSQHSRRKKNVRITDVEPDVAKEFSPIRSTRVRQPSRKILEMQGIGIPAEQTLKAKRARRTSTSSTTKAQSKAAPTIEAANVEEVQSQPDAASNTGMEETASELVPSDASQLERFDTPPIVGAEQVIDTEEPIDLEDIVGGEGDAVQSPQMFEQIEVAPESEPPPAAATSSGEVAPPPAKKASGTVSTSHSSVRFTDAVSETKKGAAAASTTAPPPPKRTLAQSYGRMMPGTSKLADGRPMDRGRSKVVEMLRPPPAALSKAVHMKSNSARLNQMVPRPPRDGSDLPDEHRPRERARQVGLHVRGHPLTTVPSPFQRLRKQQMQQQREQYHQQQQHQQPANDFVTEQAKTLLPETSGEVSEEIVEEVIGGVHDESFTVVDEHGEPLMDESGQPIMYMGEGDIIEEVEYDNLPADMQIVEIREVENEDGTTTTFHEVVQRQNVKIEDTTDENADGTQRANESEDTDEVPPQLEPEDGPRERHPMEEETIDYSASEMIRVQSPGGTQQFVQLVVTADGREIYVDGNGEVVQMMDTVGPEDLRTIEFNFLDSKNICCGLCGEIVPYDTLMNDHLPNHHPEVMNETTAETNDVPYESWLREKLYNDNKHVESGFREMSSDLMQRLSRQRMLRRVSQIRVNPMEMTIPQLEHALKRKMVEKMGRKVPVSLVDKQHARCGICNAVVSLNKKFEIIHLVRHFNAWHPSAHRCAGTWGSRTVQPGMGKPLSIHDFAVVDLVGDAPEGLQCIWCGMFMERNALAMHFTEVHPEEVEVPKCLLCMQEIVINARLLEKFGEDFEIVLPDEFHIKCNKFQQTFSTEKALDRFIEKNLQRAQNPEANGEDENEGEDQNENDRTYTNSRMQFGKRNKPKRSFVQPCFRQAIPTNSQYVEAVTEGQWRCKMCGDDIFGAVISAGAIKHYKLHHPVEMESMQYELCKARLERVSDGCMEFVHPQLVECLICNLTYALHKPYNMCRGIRHLKSKHPEMMPEFSGNPLRMNPVEGEKDASLQVGEVISDPEIIARFKNEYSVDFDKVQTFYGADGEPVYVLMGENDRLDEATTQEIAQELENADEIVDEGVEQDVEQGEYEAMQDEHMDEHYQMTAPKEEIEEGQEEMYEGDVYEEVIVEQFDDENDDMEFIEGEFVFDEGEFVDQPAGYEEV